MQALLHTGHACNSQAHEIHQADGSQEAYILDRQPVHEAHGNLFSTATALKLRCLQQLDTLIGQD